MKPDMEEDTVNFFASTKFKFRETNLRCWRSQNSGYIRKGDCAHVGQLRLLGNILYLDMRAGYIGMFTL